MQIETSRFGTIDVPDDELLTFERGLIGFYDERKFIVVAHGTSEYLAWLQSCSTPELAFPVVSAHAFDGYPDVSLEASLADAGLETDGDDLALIVVLTALQGRPATVNLLAPLAVDMKTRQGAQVILQNTCFSAREIFVLGLNARDPSAAGASEQHPSQAGA